MSNYKNVWKITIKRSSYISTKWSFIFYSKQMCKREKRILAQTTLLKFSYTPLSRSTRPENITLEYKSEYSCIWYYVAPIYTFILNIYGSTFRWSPIILQSYDWNNFLLHSQTYLKNNDDKIHYHVLVINHPLSIHSSRKSTKFFNRLVMIK